MILKIVVMIVYEIASLLTSCTCQVTMISELMRLREQRPKKIKPKKTKQKTNKLYLDDLVP